MGSHYIFPCTILITDYKMTRPHNKATQLLSKKRYLVTTKNVK